MKKLKFYVSTGFVGSKREEIVEVEDNATDDEIQEEFNLWMWENISAGWLDIEEE